MNINTFLIDPDKMPVLRGGQERKITVQESTGLNPTDIFGVDNHDDTITVSRETWRRIELLAIVLSATNITIDNDRLNAMIDAIKQSQQGGGK